MSTSAMSDVPSGAPPSAAASPTGPTDLFISYPWGPIDAATGKRPLQERVLVVVAQLREAGFTTWLDLERMAGDATGGAGTDEAMAQGILGAGAVVCFFSAEYARSANCKLEAQFAKKKGKPIFFVNVGAQGYLPDRYSKAEASVVSWLDVLVMNALWFDARDEGRVAAETKNLISALRTNAERALPGNVGPEDVAAVDAAPAIDSGVAQLRAQLAVMQQREQARQEREAAEEAERAAAAAVKESQLAVMQQREHARQEREAAEEAKRVAAAAVIESQLAAMQQREQARQKREAAEEAERAAAAAVKEAQRKAAADKAAQEAAAVKEAKRKADAELAAQQLAARLEAERIAKLPQGEQDKARRAALGPEVARAKGHQLFVACVNDRNAAVAQQLISEGADPNFFDNDGLTSLMAGSVFEELNGVAARLIAAGAELNLVEKDGHSALMGACHFKRAPAALLLIEAGAFLNLVDDGGMSALDYADKNGLAAVSAAIRARGGRAAAELKVELMAAELKIAASGTRALLEAGNLAKAARAAIGPEAARIRGIRLLAVCSRWRTDPVAALRLICEGADLECLSKDGRTPLMFASASAALDIVAARLITAGAKLELASGKSALRIACVNKRAATALLLLVEAGTLFKLNQVTQGGYIANARSVLDEANARGLVSVAAAIRARGGLTAADIAKSSDVGIAGEQAKAARSALGWGAACAKGYLLLKACKEKDAAAALRLISEGANPNCADEVGDTPLILASGYLELDAVAARLVAAGASLDLVNKLRWSALIRACASSRSATALLLVEAGASLNLAARSSGKTALDRANENGLTSVIAAIRKRDGKTGHELETGQLSIDQLLNCLTLVLRICGGV